MDISPNTFRYIAVRRDDRPVRARIREIAAVRISYGYERICKVLRREGWPDNHKRVRRIYREEALNLRHRRRPRLKSSVTREGRADPTAAHECWAMDFVHDELFDRKKIRVLTVVDIWSRFCMALEVKKSFTGLGVAEVLERLRVIDKVKPKAIRVDNGPEFISKDLAQWAGINAVTLDFSRKGKPTDNAFCESFNGSFRAECLSAQWFMSTEDAEEKIAAWRTEYNTYRPHSSISNMTPSEMLQKHNKGPENSNSK